MLDSGDISIHPLDSDRIKSCRVTIRLGEAILVPDSVTIVDVPRGTIPSYTTHTIP